MKKILVTGASGFVGSRIVQYYKEKYEILTPQHGEMDITEEESVLRYCREHKPDVVIHCAAVSDVGICEREPEYSRKVNVTGTENVVKAAKKVGAKCICCSSDQVYCGLSDETPHWEGQALSPTNIYGKEKAFAEKSCLALDENSVHLRLSWMYDAKEEKRMDFIKQIRSCAAGSKEYFFSPLDKRGITDVWEVVRNMEATFELPGGVYNFGSSNDRSTYETVIGIFEKKGYDTSLVKKLENANFRNLTMSQKKLNGYGICFSTTEEGVLKVWK